MLSIPVGAKGSFSLVVRPEHLASRFKDATLPPVLATPGHSYLRQMLSERKRRCSRRAAHVRNDGP
jgi:hypothetical protein